MLQFGYYVAVNPALYGWYTISDITFASRQLAFRMRFKEIALVGCDYNFTTQGPSNKVVKSGAVDENHFDPNYFAGGMPWRLPNLLKSELVYTLVRDVLHAEGRAIVNATEGELLDGLSQNGSTSIFKALGAPWTSPLFL